MKREELIEAITKRATGGRITCADCFQIAEKYAVSKRRLGELLDELKIKVIDCQLGLFKKRAE